ncbi:hypothetical protein EV682_10966 [Iodobacter fluviatilis]|uniref:Uncharacterized protein n=1 Tax=Iodobacter fluviatilis TaxID=537 RepID=A0A377Q5B5_9NEIS|nr:hypothetical protein EV682_10966 [Iodobacter fluviatilis]STQ90007.1 Uncharacterised protein [Iodobacter fluviatilis]
MNNQPNQSLSQRQQSPQSPQKSHDHMSLMSYLEEERQRELHKIYSKRPDKR